MSLEQQCPKDSPLMVAWDAYKSTDEYKNSLSWATRYIPEDNTDLIERARALGGNPVTRTDKEKYVEGSLWAAFMAGFLARYPSEDQLLSPRAVEVAARAIFAARGWPLAIHPAFEHEQEDWMACAEAALTAYHATLAVDGLCLVEQRSESSTELKIGDRVRVSMRRRRLMYETEPFWRGQIIGETREGHAWIVRRDLYKTPAAYHKNFCSKEIAAASTGDSTRQEKI